MRRADLIERLVWMLLVLAVCLVAAPGRAIAAAETPAQLIPLGVVAMTGGGSRLRLNACPSARPE